MALTIIFDAEDPQQGSYLHIFDSQGTGLDQSFVRGDENLSLELRPVEKSLTSTRPWDDAHATGDTYQVAIGNPDEPPASGSFPLDLTGPPFSTVFSADMSVGLATALSGATYGDVQVTLLSAGTYQVIWDDAGAVPEIDTSGANTLTPDATVSVLVEEAGDATTRAIQIILLRKTPVAFAEPATNFPVASVIANITQAGSVSANKIYAIELTPGTYGGTFSVSVTDKDSLTESVGLASGTITDQDFAALLATHSGIASTDVSVQRVGDTLNVEFRGTQALSDVPVIAVTNQGLLAPKGVSGIINLNTFSLYRSFYNTTANTLSFTLAIRRSRATGEKAEVFQRAITLKRNIINVTTLVPVLLPTYYTTAESNLHYVGALPTFAGLTGGTATDLDVIAVNAAMAGRIVYVADAVYPGFWRLQAGTNAEDESLGIVRPDNYATTTNEFVWIQLL